jgi:threonine ammonia-lyase medium form
MAGERDGDRLVGIDEIWAARRVIAPYVHRTPTFTATALGKRTGTTLHFKAELFQKTGSFKPRGALNKMMSLADEDKARGVITISAGNHAQGVAYAAGVLGIAATVVMPEAAVQRKVDATRGYGATVILHGTGKDLLPKAQELQRERDLTFIPPFDDPLIIAGHGTVGLELMEDVPAPDVVIVPVGGGGLISGVAAAVKALKPSTRVIGVEPVGAAVMTMSLAAGAPAHLDTQQTIADGLTAPFAGALNLLHVHRLVDEVVLVTDDEIVDALRLIMERGKLMPEPSGAASFAALLAGKVAVDPGAVVVCVISGGNMDRGRLKDIL